MEETKKEGPTTTPVPTEYELARDYKPTQFVSQEEARREIAKTNEDQQHPYWDFSHRHHEESVGRMTLLYSIVNPEKRTAPGQISKAMDLREAGVTEEELTKIPEKLQDFVDEQEMDKALKPLQEAWGEKFNKNLTLVKKTVSSFASKEQIDFLTQSGLGNDQEFIEAVLKVGTLIQQREARMKERKP